MRRRPAAPGVRPPRVNEERTCVVCGAAFVLDRTRNPWSRARTCSPAHAKILANRGRTVSTCRHCDMVEGYHLERDAQIRQREVAAGDEDLHPVTFHEWLATYSWEPDPAAT